MRELAQATTLQKRSLLFSTAQRQIKFAPSKLTAFYSSFFVCYSHTAQGKYNGRFQITLSLSLPIYLFLYISLSPLSLSLTLSLHGALQIERSPDNFPFNNKFFNQIKKIALQNQPIFFLNAEVMYLASGKPLTALYIKSSMLYLSKFLSLCIQISLSIYIQISLSLYIQISLSLTLTDPSITLSY